MVELTEWEKEEIQLSIEAEVANVISKYLISGVDIRIAIAGLRYSSEQCAVQADKLEAAAVLIDTYQKTDDAEDPEAQVH